MDRYSSKLIFPGCRSQFLQSGAREQGGGVHEDARVQPESPGQRRGRGRGRGRPPPLRPQPRRAPHRPAPANLAGGAQVALGVGGRVLPAHHAGGGLRIKLKVSTKFCARKTLKKQDFKYNFFVSIV